MTYWSSIWRISCGVGSLLLSVRAASALAPSSRMMSLQSSMHSSQMNTEGPAMSFRTSCWLLPQKEQYRSLSPGVFSAIQRPPVNRGRYTLLGLGPALQHLVDQAVIDGFLGCEKAVAIGVLLDLLDRLPGVLGHQAVHALAKVQDELSVDGDIRRLTLEATERLVNQDRGVREREALALGTGGQQKRAHARGHTDAQRRDVALDELHRVVDRHARRDRTSRRVDV